MKNKWVLYDRKISGVYKTQWCKRIVCNTKTRMLHEKKLLKAKRKIKVYEYKYERFI